MEKVTCKNCEWKWEIEKDDKNPYLCHKCGYNNKKDKFDQKALNKWKSDNRINESEMNLRKIIREEVAKVLSENDSGYFTLKTGAYDYDNLLGKNYDSLPKQWNETVGDIKYMTFEEYIKAVAKLQGTSYDEQLAIIREENVNKIIEDMSAGKKYHIGYLDYVNNQQEGRHRVAAAHKLGQEKIPVLIIDHIKSDDESFTKTYNLGNFDEITEFTLLFKDVEAVEDAINVIRWPNQRDLDDGEWEFRMKHGHEYLPLHDWSEASEVYSLVKRELSKLPKEKIIEGIELADSNDELHILEHLQGELPELFKYIQRLIYGTTKYMVDSYNSEILGEIDEYGINIQIDRDTINVNSKHGKDDIKHHDFNFINQESDEVFKLDGDIIKSWMSKYPFKN